MTKYIYKYLIAVFNLITLLTTEYNLKQKYILIKDYIRFTLKYFILVDLLGMLITKERIINHKIKVINYAAFYSLFVSIFIEREYAFISNSRSPIIFDCGSNIGMSIFYFKFIYPNSNVISFEPHVPTYQVLQENILKNKIINVNLNNVAVANISGEMSLFSDYDNVRVTGMSLTKRLSDKNNKLIEDKVKTVLISSYITRSVDFLKMDIEGSELSVLKELFESAKISFIKQMVIEFHYDSKNNPENNLSFLLDILMRSGFDYLIKGYNKPPFYKYICKPYNLLVYAYR